MTKERAPKLRTRRSLRVFWTDLALSDLETIGDYIARDNPVAAERWVMKLYAVAEKAALTPLAGRRVPEVARDDVHETSLRTYRIVYRVGADRFEILTIFEGHRLFPQDLVLPGVKGR